jgi:hypothetical protein
MILQNTPQVYRNIALIMLLKQAAPNFIVSGEVVGVDFMALSVIFWLYIVEWCFIAFSFYSSTLTFHIFSAPQFHGNP